MDPDPAGKPGEPTSLPLTAEFAAIARWTRSAPAVGDDVAWIDAPARLALSVDTVVQDVHFKLEWSSPSDVGWKAATAALSDLAAARARPVGALVSLAVPVDDFAAGGRADALMAGLSVALEHYGCPLLGGDTVRTDGPITVSVTVLGAPTNAGPLLRSGAQVGDLVQISGFTGRAADAVAALEADQVPSEDALAAHRRPSPRLDLLDAIAAATAGVDVSDGLLADAAWIARASDVTLVLDHDACIAGPARPIHALSGGEDYELIVTAPIALPGFRAIGVVRPGPAAMRWSDGSPIDPAGWDHGSST